MAKSKRMQISGTTAILADKLAARLTHYRPALPAVLLGPVVWTIPDGHDQKVWYFAVAHGKAGSDQFQMEQIQGDKAAMLDLRGNLLVALISHRPVTIHDCGDELIMARWLTAQFPGERSTRILHNVQQEREASHV